MAPPRKHFDAPQRKDYDCIDAYNRAYSTWYYHNVKKKNPNFSTKTSRLIKPNPPMKLKPLAKKASDGGKSNAENTDYIENTKQKEAEILSRIEFVEIDFEPNLNLNYLLTEKSEFRVYLD